MSDSATQPATGILPLPDILRHVPGGKRRAFKDDDRALYAFRTAVICVLSGKITNYKTWTVIHPVFLTPSLENVHHTDRGKHMCLDLTTRPPMQVLKSWFTSHIRPEDTTPLAVAERLGAIDPFRETDYSISSPWMIAFFDWQYLAMTSSKDSIEWLNQAGSSSARGRIPNAGSSKSTSSAITVLVSPSTVKVPASDSKDIWVPNLYLPGMRYFLPPFIEADGEENVVALDMAIIRHLSQYCMDLDKFHSDQLKVYATLGRSYLKRTFSSEFSSNHSIQLAELPRYVSNMDCLLRQRRLKLEVPTVAHHAICPCDSYPEVCKAYLRQCSGLVQLSRQQEIAIGDHIKEVRIGSSFDARSLPYILAHHPLDPAVELRDVINTSFKFRSYGTHGLSRIELRPILLRYSLQLSLEAGSVLRHVAHLVAVHTTPLNGRPLTSRALQWFVKLALAMQERARVFGRVDRRYQARHQTPSYLVVGASMGTSHASTNAEMSSGQHIRNSIQS